MGLKSENTRRPSPWTDLAHSLSETSTPHRPRSTSASLIHPKTTSPSPSDIPSSPTISPESQLSSSALREWDRLLLESSGNAKRHHLIHPSTTGTISRDDVKDLRYGGSEGSLGAPKLAAERDKEGHIEYKLKLIDPTPDRFERLVTQMLWRLKQGRNEAIYEIGLADDGTVIGLTRQEMDASLSTLEAMAAEVGGTVLILKEIVLSASTTNIYPGSTSSVSDTSAISLSSDAAWTIRRPDLDEMGRPRKGSRNNRGCRIGQAKIKGEVGKEKQVLFDQDQSGDGDEDTPQFHLELDPTSTPSPPTTKRLSRWKRRTTISSDRPTPSSAKLITPELLASRAEKTRLKAIKSAEKREMRRMELYKGDGMNPMWVDTVPTGNKGSTLRILPTYPMVNDGDAGIMNGRGNKEDGDEDEDEESDSFLADLLSVPLDNLSLSFSEVRTVIDLPSSSSGVSTTSSPSSSPIVSSPSSPISSNTDEDSQTEYATSPSSTLHRIPPPRRSSNYGDIHEDGRDDDESWKGAGMIRGIEMICVEALVVRKTAEGVAGVQEWCDDGDDVWGFGHAGAGDGDDGEGEVDPEDGWGFE